MFRMNLVRRGLTAGLLGMGLSAVALGQTLPPIPKPDNDINRTELRNYDQFMDQHPEMAREVNRNPRLLDNPNYVRNHPELKQFLQTHPGVRQEVRENPRQFAQQERRYNRIEDRRQDRAKGEQAQDRRQDRVRDEKIQDRRQDRVKDERAQDRRQHEKKRDQREDRNPRGPGF